MIGTLLLTGLTLAVTVAWLYVELTQPLPDRQQSGPGGTDDRDPGI
ncbi:hypothetical protein [Halorientalis halophila]